MIKETLAQGAAVEVPSRGQYADGMVTVSARPPPCVQSWEHVKQMDRRTASGSSGPKSVLQRGGVTCDLEGSRAFHAALAIAAARRVAR